MHLKRALVTVGATVGVGATIGMCAAGAAQAHVVTRTPSVIAASGLHPFSAPAGDGNPYQAGWGGPTSSSASLSATVTVPKLTCTAKDTMDVVTTVYLIGGTGTASGGDIFLSCQGGDYLRNVTDNQGDADGTPVSAGDVIQFSESSSASGETETYTDTTTGATATDTGPGFAPESAIAVGQGLYDSSTPKDLFPKFSPMKFSAVTIDGTALGSDSPGEYYQETAAGKKQITSSAITKGTNFTVTYVSG